MAEGRDLVFSFIRRRDNLKRLRLETVKTTLPQGLTQTPLGDQSRTPSNTNHTAHALSAELQNLVSQKRAHLSVPEHKGGKKMNKMSYVILFFGLLLAGTLFFAGGFFLCYTVYPPYGGVLLHPKYAALPSNPPLSEGGAGSLDHKESLSPAESFTPPTGPQGSYVRRQAVLSHFRGQMQNAQNKGFFEQAQERVQNNASAQINNLTGNLKEQISRQVHVITRKVSQAFRPATGNILSPVIEGLPDQWTNQALKEVSSAASPTPQAPQKNLEQSLPSSSSPSSNSLDSVTPLYTVRVRKFEERQDALKLAEELKRKGFEGYVVPVWHGQKGVFEVRSGQYSTFAQAQEASRFLQHNGLDLTTVTPLNPQETLLTP